MSVQDILINGKIASQYYNGSTFPNIDIDQVTGLEAALTVITDDIADINNSVGQPDGLCPLNALGQIDPSYLDPSVFTFEGVWDASIGVGGIPTLVNGVGNTGDMYIVSVSGVQFGETFVAGDFVVYANGLWEKISSSTGGSILISAGLNIDVTGTPQAPTISTVANPSFTQVAVSAVAPIAVNDLTRKDYVDNFINSASNLGVSTYGLFKQKVTNDLQFKSITAGSNKINLISNANDVSVDVNEANLTLTKAQVGLGNVENLKSNLIATTDPTVSDDSSLGYSVGSRWLNNTNDTIWDAFDVTPGSAVWTAVVTEALNTGFAAVGLFKNKTGKRLNFKNFGSTFGVEVIDYTDTVDFRVTPNSIGLGNVPNTKMNFTAVVDPTPADSGAGGWSVGSLWLNVSTDAPFICLDASVSAVWRKLEYRTSAANFQSVELTAGGNAVNLTGANSLIRLGGTDCAIINNGINGNNDRVDISRGCYFFQYNNTFIASMNIAVSTVFHDVNVSNLSTNTENIFALIPVTPRYFPFTIPYANSANIRGDLSQTSMYVAWRINGATSISGIRFGLMSAGYLENYSGSVTVSSNRNGLYSAGQAPNNGITLNFTTLSGEIHQNDTRLPSSSLGTPYAGGVFTTNDIIILESIFSNPPRIRLHSYGFASGIATFKCSYVFDLRSASLLGGDTMCFNGYPYINLQSTSQNINVIGQRWITQNISSWSHGAGLFNNTTALSYYY